MSAVIQRTFFLAGLALALAACGAGQEKQWYKPNADYTMADFQRDRGQCMKSKVLDEECMRDRGWVAISADQDKGPPPMQGGPTPAKSRYGPK
jgi:hypothetical protein